MTDHVPEEVVADILARLSVKEIVKCRSVCKSWYSLISSNVFQSYHLNKSTARNRSLVLVRDGIDFDNGKTEHYSFYLDDDDFPSTRVLELDCPFKAISLNSRIVGCCNGVVCFIDHTLDYNNDRAALWNPSIRKLVEIPPPIVASESGGPYGPTVGFGYDALNDDYKLVRVSVDASKGHLIEVYSLRCGSWRMVDSHFNRFIGGPCVHIDGVCYWLGSRRNPNDADLIVSFTLSNEVFDEFPLPNDLPRGGSLLNIASLWKGSLFLMVQDYLGMIVNEGGIRVMKEGAWMKLKHPFMESETSHTVLRVLALKDDDVVWFSAAAGLNDEDECLVRQDLKTRVEVEFMVVEDLGFYLRTDTLMEGFLVLLPALSSAMILMLLASPLLVQIGRAEVKCLESDKDALLDFKDGLMDPSNRLVSWTGLSNCCQWSGISCDNITGAVVSLDLHSQNAVDLFAPGSDGLSGEIRPSLAKLKSLKRLDLSSNAFDGVQIPEFLHSFKQLDYLNLANAGFYGSIPSSLGNISTLKYLNLSSHSSYLAVSNLDWLSSLVSLRYLVLNGVDLSYSALDWIEMLNMIPNITDIHLSSCKLNSSISDQSFQNLTSLFVLDLSLNRFNSEFPYWVSNISSLVSVDLRESRFKGSFPVDFGEMPNLEFLHLSGNSLGSDVADIFSRAWSRLHVIDLSWTRLYGEIPKQIGNMTSLTHLDLRSNKIRGKIPHSISALRGLTHLDLSNNRLSGSLQILKQGTQENCCDSSACPFPLLERLFLNNNTLEGVLPCWLGKLPNLVELILDSNSFEGPILPSLGNLSLLNELILGGNLLNGTLPESFGQLLELKVLDVSFNRLHGVVSEAHFRKRDKLVILKLSSNSFIMNISSNWDLPSNLWMLEMGSCQIGPSFPLWLKSHQQLAFLDLSNASISGGIPSWFWDVTGGLKLLNYSMNQLRGRLPSQLNFSSFGEVDLSFNQFEGPIPMDFVNELFLLSLSNNRLSGTIPENIGDVFVGGIFLSLSANQLTGNIPDSIGNITYARGIDLSYNNLTGSIPGSLGNCLFLQVLDLQNNNLSGVIPDSLGQLSSLFSLHLRDNMLTGRIPGPFRNLTSLETLDLGHNRLSGELPLWMGYFLTSLRILSLRSNTFSGQLPSTLARLESLLVLDLAGNQFNGTIPANFRNFKVMLQKQSTFRNWRYMMGNGNYYKENIIVTLKGMSWKFTRTLSFLTCIDLSRNNLHGDFPTQLTELAGLVVLSLSGNRFEGQIPSNISELTQLSSLDLSNNQLSGPIPPSLAGLSFMGYLNLSENNLSGRIPFNGQLVTFENSSFSGNPGLCGPPLVTSCSDDGSSDWGATGQNFSNGGRVDRMLYFSIAFGFATGISVPFYVYAIRKSWSDAYFLLVDATVDRLCLFGGKAMINLRSYYF
ncbi:Receptor-like protein EIX2 [Linum perenne]